MSCKTMSIDLANVPPVPIQIGVAGENAFRTITFDASTWGADFPDATYTVVYKRSDGYIYPVLVNAAAGAIVWSPTDTDTAVSGNGQIEVRLLDGETIGKTIVMQTFVAPSLSGDESEPSTPAPDWVNDVAADADRAEAAVEHYPKIVNGVWYVWDVQSEDFISTGIEAQGEEGYSPTVTVTAIDGGHRVTITDADGAHTFDVMDGQGGTGGAVESVNGQTGTVVLDASDVGALPDDTPIPAAVTEQTVAGWGFTKNTGDYSKPDNGIPKTDLAEDVRTSLGRADTALQTAPVESVNGKTGVVVLDAEDVGALPNTYTAPVQSVNGQTGAVVLGASDVHALPDSTVIPPTVTEQTVAQWGFTKNTGTYSKPSGGIPKTDLAQAVQTSLGKADTALQTAPVTSVNNKTGAVTLTASDVGALPSSTSIPTKTSELTNDSGYQTAAQVQTAIAGKADAASVYTKSEVDQKLVGAMDYKGTKATVSELPTSGNETGDVWHITADGSEWAWNGSAWEELGTAVDLSGYATEQWVENKGYLTQHQSLAAYRTASAQDAIDAAQNTAIAAKANSADLSEVAFSGDYNDLLNRPDEDYIFADEIPQNADHSAKYVLPDGYIYVYGEHTYHRVYNAATNGLLNKVPVINQSVETTGDKAGAFLSAPIPWDSSWTQYEKTPTVVRITGNKTLSPIWYNSAIQVFYYKANGDYKTSLNQSAIHSFVGGSPALGASISLPCEFNLADLNFYPLENTGFVRIYLGISSDGSITANDVNDIVINVPFYDTDVTETGWYNTGERYISDPQVEQNTEDIADLDTRVTALEEDSGSGDGGITVSTNQVLYAVGDSITRGAVAGGEDYAWPKHVIDINGYDAVNSLNLGQNGLGFDTAATGSGDTIKAIVDRTDFSAADIVTVALGCNDWKNSNARLANIWTNMEYCFNKIRTDNPYCKLFYILPFNMSFGGTFNTFYCLSFKGDSNPLCPYSYTLMQYINMIKDKLATPTFQAFRINVIDMVECAAINRQNITTALADQVHPTAATQAELGKEIARRIVLADGAGGVLPIYAGGVS